MEIKIDIPQKELKQKVIEEVALLIYNEDSNRRWFGWGSELDKIVRDKAIKMLREDKKFDDMIKAKVRKQINNPKLIRSVAKGIIEDKLGDTS